MCEASLWCVVAWRGVRGVDRMLATEKKRSNGTTEGKSEGGGNYRKISQSALKVPSPARQKVGPPHTCV